MKKPVKLFLGAVAAVVVVAGLYLLNRYWIAPATERPKTASNRPPAPDFTLKNLEGRDLRLGDYRGKVVIVDFWATWCGPCRVEIPGFVDLVNRYGSQGLVILGISMDDGPEPVREFYREYKMNYPVAMGNDRVAELFGGILGLPTTFIIGRDGRIYAKHTGLTPHSTFEEAVKKLLAASLTEEVADFQPTSARPGTGSGEPIHLGNPAEINSEVPGVDLSKLSAAQKEEFKAKLEKEKCSCGCGLNLLRCRIDDSSCTISRGLARQMLAQMPKP